MVTTYSTEAQLALNTIPAKKVDGAKWGARMRRYRATVALAGQASGDDIVLFRVPKGSVFAYGVLNASVSLGGTATVAIGASGSTGKYRAAATFQTPNAPTFFGANAAVAADALSADEDVLLTIGTAALPGSGTLVVDVYVSNG